MSALARETTNVRLSALVTGNTYRNPAILAKTVTTLDIVSNGRVEFGGGRLDSGAPLAGDPSWEAQRYGVRERTEAGFATSPVLADLAPGEGSGLDIIAAGEDRHVYAWHPDGKAVKGRINQVLTFQGLERVQATEAGPGEIVLIVTPLRATSSASALVNP